MKPRLCGCTLDQLDELTNLAFDAPTLDAFLAEISKPDEASKNREDVLDNADGLRDDKPSNATC